MARPTKQGIDYFPLDCQLDDKTEMYLIEKGAVGLAVLVTTWQMIYSNEGYYIENNIDLHLLIKRKIDVGINEVSDCINTCLRRNLFDTNLGNKHNILTSKAIQKRYFDIARKKKFVNIIEEFLLISVDSIKNPVNVGINSVNSGENATNVKVKEEVKVKVKEKVLNTLSSKPDDDLILDSDGQEKKTMISQAEELLDFMNEKLNRNFRAKNPNGTPTANAEIIIKRLKDGYTVQQMRSVMARKKREWQDQDSMSKYLRPETLFGKTKFASYLGECGVVEKDPEPEAEFENIFDDFPEDLFDEKPEGGE